MSCQQTILDYGLRSLGYGERLLPKSDFTLCQHFTLIGSGLIWNIYFGALALLIGFFIANAMALAKASPRAILRRPAEWFILIFRGSPLFIRALGADPQHSRLFCRNFLRRVAVRAKRRG